MFLSQVITFVVPSGDIYLSVASWYVLFGSFDDCRDKLAIRIVYISGVFGSGVFKILNGYENVDSNFFFRN